MDLVPILCSMMTSASSLPLIRNSAVDIVAGSCVRNEISIEFINQCALEIDALIGVYFDIQLHSSVLFDAFRAEKLLLAIQCIALTKSSKSQAAKAAFIFAVIDKLLWQVSVIPVSDPLILVKMIVVLLEHCSCAVASQESSNERVIVLSDKSAASLRKLVIQCLHGGAKQDIRDKILVILSDVLLLNNMSQNWCLELFTENSQENKPIGSFIKLVCMICKSEFHLLLEEAIYLCHHDATELVEHLSGDQIAERKSRFHKVSVVTAQVLRVLFQLMTEKFADDLSSVVSAKSFKITQLVPAVEQQIYVDISGEVLLALKGVLDSCVSDVLEFSKELSGLISVIARDDSAEIEDNNDKLQFFETLGTLSVHICQLAAEDDSFHESFVIYSEYYVKLSAWASKFKPSI